MADRSFEQRVKEELASLKMMPAEEVWANVEADLHKEKKRRWLTWFFLLAGLSAASFAIYSGMNGTHKTGATITTKVISTDKKIKAGNHITPGEPVMQKNTGVADQQSIKEKQTAAIAPVEKHFVKEDHIKKYKQNDKPGNMITDHTVVVKDNEPPKEITVNKNNGSTKRITARKNNGLPKETAVTKNNRIQNTTPLAKNGDQNLVAPTQQAQLTDALTNKSEKITSQKRSAENTNGSDITSLHKGEDLPVNKEPGTVTEKAIAKADTTTPQKTGAGKKQQQHKWQWSIAGMAGSSSLSSFPVVLPVLNGSVTVPGGGGTFNPSILYTKDPEVKSAFSYGIQLQTETPIGKKSAVRFSAGYALFQTTTTIGRRVDSIAYFSSASSYNSNGYYYRNSDSLSYNNHYHFLQLGIDLVTSFKLFTAISARWEIGGGVSFLAGSNGLHYDNTTYRSFMNNSLLTKCLPYVSTGIDFSLGKKPFLYIGPHWEYQLAKLSNQNNETGHFLLSSVRLSFILPKNKK